MSWMPWFNLIGGFLIKKDRLSKEKVGWTYSLVDGYTYDGTDYMELVIALVLCLEGDI